MLREEENRQEQAVNQDFTMQMHNGHVSLFFDGLLRSNLLQQEGEKTFHRCIY